MGKELSIGVKLITDLKDFISGFKKAQDTSEKFGETVDKKLTSPLRAMEGQLRSLKQTQRKALTAEEYQRMQKEIDKTTAAINKFKGKTTESAGPLGKLKSLLPTIGFAAVAAGITGLVSNIINVRKEFEKYEAVLTNTLGSQKEARQEMSMLVKFASETPFALTELTGAFVKLTNYGLKPSKEEMRSYGDLASSVGKGFDQFAEALADAVTGEFERLKEFGIKSKKEGDKITFTFKEQSTVVANNADAIKTYIAGLGNLQGVSGSMAAIAATLGGKISNMGDAWDGLMNTMGSGTSGIMVTVIGWMTSFVNTLDNALKSVQMIKQAVKDESIVSSMQNALGEIETMEKSLVKNGVSQAEAHKRAIELYNKSIDDGIASTQASFRGKTEDQKTQLAKQLNLMIEERKAVTAHFKNLEEIEKKKNDNKITPKINGLDAQIKTLKDQQDALNGADITSIQIIGAKITALEKLKQAYANIASDPASFRTDHLDAIPTGRVTGKLSVSSGEKKKEVNVYSNTYSSNGPSQPLENMGDSIDVNTQRLEKFKEGLDDLDTRKIESLSNSFGSLGDSIGGVAGSFLSMVGNVLGMIPTLIAQITALTAVQVASDQATVMSSASVTAAKSSEAIATGTSQAMKLPPIVNIVALAATIAAIVSALATPIKGFAVGGVVPGSSFIGDKVLARVNSGEEILTASDPRHRNNRGQSSKQSNADVAIINEARIKGEDLYILMKKAERRINRRT